MISDLRNKIKDLSNEITSAIAEASNINDVEEIRINTLGKKGTITSYLKNLREYDEASKKEIGALINETKNKINQLIIDKKSFFKTKTLNEKLITEKIDVTLTPHENEIGTLHPLSRTIEELCAIFSDMDFSIVEGPDIETDYYNFTALNIPSNILLDKNTILFIFNLTLRVIEKS